MAADPAVAFRCATQGLAGRDGTLESVAAAWAVQDSPPGSAALALAARMPALAPDDLERALLDDRTLVALYNPRTATAVIPAADLARFGAALDPGDGDLPVALQRALPEDGSIGAREAFDLATAAIADALDGGPLRRDDLHEQLRRALPPSLLPWCPGCESHHARRGLLVVAGLRGALCHAGRAGRQVRFARPDRWLGETPSPVAREEALRALAERYLHGYGPSTPAQLAAWAGIAPSHARAAFAAAADVLHDAGEGVVLAADAPLLADPPAPTGVALLPPGDPLLQARDRERLVPDADLRRRAWPSAAPPGAVLADGALVALWRGRKRGRRLEVELIAAPGERLATALRRAIEAEAARIAPLRGCTGADVVAG